MTDVAQNYHTIPYNTTIYGNYYSACVFNGVRYVDGWYKFGRYYNPRAQYPEWDVEQWYCPCCNHNATVPAAMQFNFYGELDRRNDMYPWLDFSCQGYYWQNSGSANWSVKSISFHPKNMGQTACRKRDEWCHQRKHGQEISAWSCWFGFCVCNSVMAIGAL